MASYHLPNTPSMNSGLGNHGNAISRTYCRLCLEETEDFTSLHYTGNKFSTPPSIMIKSLVPELYTGVSLNPVICSHCLEELYSCYEFRLKCLKTENLIGIYLTETKSNSPCIRLNDVVGYWKFRAKNENQKQPNEDDCVTIVDHEPLEEVSKPKIPSEATKLRTEQKKPITMSEPSQEPKSTIAKPEFRPMLKPIDIAKLMDPGKRGMFAMDKSPEKNTSKPDLVPKSPRSLLKSTVLTPEGHINFPHGGPIEISVVSHDTMTIPSSAANTNPIERGQDSQQLKLPETLSINQANSQLKQVKLVSTVYPNNKFKKVAFKRGKLFVGRSSSPQSQIQYEIMRTTTKKPVESSDVEDVILRNILNKPGLSNDSGDMILSSTEQNEAKSDSNKQISESSKLTVKPPMVLNAAFEAGDSILNTAPPPTAVSILPDSQHKEKTAVRTLNHEISFPSQGPANIDLEHEPVVTSIIYKPNDPTVPSRGNQPCTRGKGCCVSKPCVRTVKINPFSATNKGKERNDLNFSIGQTFTMNPEQRILEDQIDIKDEPLDLELLNSDQLSQQVDEELRSLKSLFPNEFDQAASGESTRSASEVSCYERMPLRDDTDDEFTEDHPEFVEINKITKPSTAPPPPDSNPSPQFSIASTNLRKRTRIRKRLKLVPVDFDEMPLEMSVVEPVVKQTRPAILRRNITPGRYRPERKSAPEIIPNQNNVDMFSNFSNTGDFVNDHDYLVSPYVRHKIYYRTNNGLWLCCCLLCDLLQAENDHMAHMEKHDTICDICNIDFQNVFILNLHAKLHVRRCRKCQRNITYPMYADHKMACVGDWEYQMETEEILPKMKTKIVSRQYKPHKNSSLPKSKTQSTLIENYLPIEEGFQPLEEQSSENRYKRYKSPTPEDEEEEACIYDKVSKRFITPSMMKQQKRRSRLDSEEDNICLKKLLDELKLKEQLAKQEENDRKFREDIVKTYSNLKLGISISAYEDLQQKISLIGILENQPFVYLSKADEEEYPGLKINKPQKEDEIPIDLTTEEDQRKDEVAIIEDEKKEDSIDPPIKIPTDLNTPTNVDKTTDSPTASTNDIVENNGISTEVRRNKVLLSSSGRKRKLAALKAAATRLNRQKQIVEDLLVNKAKIVSNNEENLTVVENTNRDLTHIERIVIAEAENDMNLKKIEHNVVSTCGGTNTSQIEELPNEPETSNELEEHSNTESSAKSSQDSTELVENPFSSRRSVRLRNRNEFTPGIVGWPTRRSRVNRPTVEKMGKIPQISPENDEKGDKLEQPSILKELQQQTSQKDHEKEDELEEFSQDTQKQDKQSETSEKHDDKDEKLNQIPNLEEIPQDIQEPVDSLEQKSIKITIPQNKLKKTKKPQLPSELETLELEMLRLKTEITKLKEMKPKKKKRKIKKIPKELIDKLRQTDNAATESSTLQQCNSEDLSELVENNSEQISIVGDETNDTKIAEKHVKISEVSPEAQEENQGEENSNTSENTTENTSETPVKKRETSFDKLEGETMEEFFKRLEHTACETSNQPRTRKRPRRLEESVTIAKRARATRVKLREADVCELPEGTKLEESMETKIENSDSVNVTPDPKSPVKKMKKTPEEMLLEDTDLKVSQDGQSIETKIENPDSVKVTPNPKNLVKKMKRTPKEMIGYKRAKGRGGFGWVKKSKKKGSSLKIVKKEIEDDEMDNKPLSEICSSTAESDPYNFDSELLEINNRAPDFITHVKSDRRRSQITAHETEHRALDFKALNAAEVPLKRKKDGKTLDKYFRKLKRSRKFVKKNPFHLKEEETAGDILPEKQQSCQDLESILQNIILQAPASSPKKIRDKSKVLLKNPLNIKNRVKRSVKRPSKLTEGATTSKITRIKVERPENVTKDSIDDPELNKSEQKSLDESSRLSQLPIYDDSCGGQSTKNITVSSEKKIENVAERRTRKSGRKQTRNVKEASQPSESNLEVRRSRQLKKIPKDSKETSTIADSSSMIGQVLTLSEEIKSSSGAQEALELSKTKQSDTDSCETSKKPKSLRKKPGNSNAIESETEKTNLSLVDLEKDKTETPNNDSKMAKESCLCVMCSPSIIMTTNDSREINTDDSKKLEDSTECNDEFHSLEDILQDILNPKPQRKRSVRPGVEKRTTKFTYCKKPTVKRRRLVAVEKQLNKDKKIECSNVTKGNPGQVSSEKRAAEEPLEYRSLCQDDEESEDCSQETEGGQICETKKMEKLTEDATSSIKESKINKIKVEMSENVTKDLTDEPELSKSDAESLKATPGLEPIQSLCSGDPCGHQNTKQDPHPQETVRMPSTEEIKDVSNRRTRKSGRRQTRNLTQPSESNIELNPAKRGDEEPLENTNLCQDDGESKEGVKLGDIHPDQTAGDS